MATAADPLAVVGAKEERVVIGMATINCLLKYFYKSIPILLSLA